VVGVADLDTGLAGVGVIFAKQEEHVFVRSVVDNSPAAAEGVIRPGDMLVTVDERPVETESLVFIRSLVMGVPGTFVTLGLIRRDAQSGQLRPYATRLRRSNSGTGEPESTSKLMTFHQSQMDLRSQLVTASTEVLELRQTVGDLQEHAVTQLQKLQDLTLRLANGDALIATQQKRIEELERRGGDADQQRQRVSELTEEVNRWRRDAENLRKFEGQARALQDELARERGLRQDAERGLMESNVSGQTITQLRQENNTLRQELEKVRASRSADEFTLDRLRSAESTVAEQTRRIRDLEEELKGKSSDEMLLRAKVDDLERRELASHAMLSESNRLARERERENYGLQRSRNQFDQELSLYASELNRERQGKKSLEQENAQLHTRLQELEGTGQMKTHDNKVLQQKYDDVIARLSEMQKSQQDIDAQNRTLEMQHRSDVERLREMQDKISQLSRNAADLASGLATEQRERVRQSEEAAALATALRGAERVAREAEDLRRWQATQMAVDQEELTRLRSSATMRPAPHPVSVAPASRRPDEWA